MTGRCSRLLMRTATTCVVLPLVLLLTWAPGWQLGFCVVVSVIAGIGLYEYYAIVRMRRISPETIGGILSGTAVVLSGYYSNPATTNFAAYGACLLVSALHIVRGQHSVAGLASSVFGVFYVGWFAAHITLLRGVPGIGPGMITMLLVIVFFNDTGAYAAGSLFGRRKLAPRVSPNKTWEGAAAGFAAACASALAFYWVRAHYAATAFPTWTPWQYVHMGAVVSVAAQVGDLMESCLKRDASVKDSGVLFPGHGGVLDRCDALLFAAPVVYYMAMPL